MLLRSIEAFTYRIQKRIHDDYNGSIHHGVDDFSLNLMKQVFKSSVISRHEISVFRSVISLMRITAGASFRERWATKTLKQLRQHCGVMFHDLFVKAMGSDP